MSESPGVSEGKWLVHTTPMMFLLACQILEDLKVYQFILWMDNFYRRNLCPTPNSSDILLNTTVFAVCLVPIRRHPLSRLPFAVIYCW